MSVLYSHDDTISAIATATGVGAIAVLRLSGPDAISIAQKLFPSKNLQSLTAPAVVVGYLYEAGQLLDEAVLTIFKAPHSYTGEDVVEISTHGSMHVQQMVLEATIHAGARLAKAGEFTQRAFLNGKMDLTQAEAVADLIASNNTAQQKASLHNLKGGFKNDLNYIREQLIEFSALLELELDFAEEDVEFADRTKFNALLSQALDKVRTLIASFQLGNVIQHGVKVAIVGRPNAGKSTLLNALLNEERAIVSSIAGTTRDTIEESLSIQGIDFRFIDTAGLRSNSTDEIELQGIEKSRRKINEADLVLLLSEDITTDQDLLLLIQAKPHIVVINKTDKQTPATKHPEYLYISAKEKTGLTALENALYNSVITKTVDPENTLITNTRHLQHLQRIQTHLLAIQTGMQEGLSSDLISPDIKLCLQEIGELTGTITNEHVLDYVFSKFCIGK